MSEKIGSLSQGGKRIGFYKESAFKKPISKGKANKKMQGTIDRMIKASQGGKK